MHKFIINADKNRNGTTPKEFKDAVSVYINRNRKLTISQKNYARLQLLKAFSHQSNDAEFVRGNAGNLPYSKPSCDINQEKFVGNVHDERSPDNIIYVVQKNNKLFLAPFYTDYEIRLKQIGDNTYRDKSGNRYYNVGRNFEKMYPASK